MKYKLLVTDIDGTLTENDGTVAKKTIDAIKAVVNSGKYVVLASGRPFVGTMSLRESLGLHGMPTICQNGSVVVDKDGKIIEKYVLADHLSPCIAGKENGCSVIAWCGDKLFCEKYDDQVKEYEKISTIPPIICNFGELKDVTKVLLISSPEETSRLEKLLQSECYACHRSRKNFLEFVSKNASKGNALETIARSLGIAIEETVALGDGMNDISMLKKAGLGVAVKNASKTVKENADTVIDSDVGDFILEIMFS